MLHFVNGNLVFDDEDAGTPLYTGVGGTGDTRDALLHYVKEIINEDVESWNTGSTGVIRAQVVDVSPLWQCYCEAGDRKQSGGIPGQTRVVPVTRDISAPDTIHRDASLWAGCDGVTLRCRHSHTHTPHIPLRKKFLH